MFTWICPQCGREVPPSYNDCPDCSAKGKAPAPAVADAPPARQPEAPAAPAAPPVPAAAARQGGVPGWLVALLVAGILIAAGAAAWLYLLPSAKARSAAKEAAPAPLETVAASPAGKPHPLARHIEITGFRINEDAKQKAQIRYLVVNHSQAEIGDLGATVTLKPATARPEDAPIAMLTFKIPTLGALESKEMLAVVQTKLRAYELPDWQFLRAQFEITSPAP